MRFSSERSIFLIVFLFLLAVSNDVIDKTSNKAAAQRDALQALLKNNPSMDLVKYEDWTGTCVDVPPGATSSASQLTNSILNNAKKTATAIRYKLPVIAVKSTTTTSTRTTTRTATKPTTTSKRTTTNTGIGIRRTTTTRTTTATRTRTTTTTTTTVCLPNENIAYKLSCCQLS